jgi:cytochrome c5
MSTPMMRTILPIVWVLAACGSTPAQPAQPSSANGKPDRASGVAAFATVRAVLQHPRCQNCHPAGDAPLQGDDSHVHSMNVQRGPDGRGMVGAECAACHGPANPPSTYGLHVPPGAIEGWRMPKPDAKLVFVGVEARALCEQIKDPARNGGKNMAALRKHLDSSLVTWGFIPGFGRPPVSIPKATFIAAWETWAAADAPCPD